MNTFWILMEQIELFIVYLVIGVILVRTGVLSDKGLDWIARVVMKLSLPTMIFVNVVSQVDRVALVNRCPSSDLAVTAFDSLIWTWRCVDKIVSCRRRPGTDLPGDDDVWQCGIYGNPDHHQHFPGTGHAVCIRIYHRGSAGDVDSRGELTSPSGKGKFDPKKLINPATVAIALAIFFVLTGLKLPGVLQTGFQNIGATATPLAMIYLAVCLPVWIYANM